MKRCPSCNRTYTDASLNFCLEDGTPLAPDAPPPPDPNVTMRYPGSRDTSEPPPTEIYRPDTSPVTPHISLPPPPPPQWTPMQQPVPQRKSNALWWVLGALGVVAVMGIGLIVVLIVISNIGGNTNNANSNRIANTNVNANASPNTNASPSPTLNANANPRDVTGPLPTNMSDDFSQSKWGVGKFQFGDIWYADDEYHMKSKERTFIVMYAPSNDYSSKDATVKVSARSVDGTVPSHGFGLMVHCAQSKTKQLEDYAFLIYPDAEPEFEVVLHKDGNQKTLVSRTKSNAIKPGSAINKLEVRVKGTELEFYVNGEFLTTISDSENYKGGRAGLYTSDVVEVVFDDLEISRETP